MLRFVRAPDGVLTPDLAGKLPGETVWVGCHAAIVEALAEQESRQDLVAMVEKLLRPLAQRSGAGQKSRRYGDRFYESRDGAVAR